MTSRIDLEALAVRGTPGRIVGPDLTNEADHFIVCGECGQAIDCRNLGSVLHHETAGHVPEGRQ